MGHIRQSRPDSGLGSQVKKLKTVLVVPSSLRSGDLRKRREVRRTVSLPGAGLAVEGLRCALYGTLWRVCGLESRVQGWGVGGSGFGCGIGGLGFAG